MEKVMENPDVYSWNGIWIIRVSSVGDAFKMWLWGQTLPLVEDDENPTDWAYYGDYSRFINGQKIID